MPITVGGGIRNIEHANNLFKNGADKIAVNTAVTKNPKLISELALKFGRRPNQKLFLFLYLSITPICDSDNSSVHKCIIQHNKEENYRSTDSNPIWKT